MSQQRVRDKRRVIRDRTIHESSQQSYMRQIRVTRYSTRGDKRREADKNVHERKRRLDNEIAPELCSQAGYVLRPGPLGLDGNEADHVLGHVMAGTPARHARAFSPGIRARLTISHASHAFSLSLRPGLGCFLASHGVDRDITCDYCGLLIITCDYCRLVILYFLIG